MAVHYTIIPSNPAGHIFSVAIRISKPDPAGQIFSMPAWIPGSYMIRDFARNVVSLKAESDGIDIPVHKQDKQTWLCDPCGGELLISYDIYAWDLSVRTAHLDGTHAYFNGTSVFMRIAGHEQQSCTMDVLPPEGRQYKNWKVSTAMTTDGATLHGFGRYTASSYDELVDHPVECGDFTLATFEVAGVPHDIVITGRHRADMNRLCRDLKVICQHHIDLFGELPEMDRYVFQVMAVGDGYGGLEHRASTSLICKRDDLPLEKDADTVTEGYRQFLGLCSHEYFHTWNVKRIKPVHFVDMDLQQEVHTNQLWAYEGITSYYDDLSLVRTGLITPESYLELLEQTVTRVWRGSGRLKQSVAESSFDTWTKFYKQDENAPNAIVSYYAKGSLLALSVDLLIRKHTSGEKSLDDVMRLLWQRHGRTGIGTEERTIEEVISEVAGADLSDFFEACLYGPEDPPLEELFANNGVQCRFRPSAGLSDKGGKSGKTDDQLLATVNLGVILAAGNTVKLAMVMEAGPAMKAGLSAGDELVAIDGIRVDKAGFESILHRYMPGDSIEIHAFRRDELSVFSVVLEPAAADTCELSVITAQLVSRWLGLEM